MGARVADRSRGLSRGLGSKGNRFFLCRRFVIGDGDAVLDQVLDGLVIQCDLTMAGQVFQVRFYHRGALLDDPCHDSPLIVWLGLAFDHADRTFRTGADAGTKAVTEKIAHEPGFAIDDLQRSLRTVGDALATTGAFRIVNADDLPLHDTFPASGIGCPVYQPCEQGSGSMG